MKNSFNYWLDTKINNAKQSFNTGYISPALKHGQTIQLITGKYLTINKVIESPFDCFVLFDNGMFVEFACKLRYVDFNLRFLKEGLVLHGRKI